MFFLAYKSLKHEVTNVTPAEFYFGRDLNLLWIYCEVLHLVMNILRNVDEYIRNLQELDEIHQNVRD